MVRQTAACRRHLHNALSRIDALSKVSTLSRVDEFQKAELAEHRAAPFPTGVEKGELYGSVEPALIDAEIFRWASQDRLEETQRRSLRQAADELAQSLDAFPADARRYFERLLRVARRAGAR